VAQRASLSIYGQLRTVVRNAWRSGDALADAHALATPFGAGTITVPTGVVLIAQRCGATAGDAVRRSVRGEKAVSGCDGAACYQGSVAVGVTWCELKSVQKCLLGTCGNGEAGQNEWGILVATAIVFPVVTKPQSAAQ
jgi:hypothetical protein